MFDFFSSVEVGFNLVRIITTLFSHHPVSYWVISNMKDMFLFSFFWLNVWCISFFYKQPVAFIIRRLYIILKTLLVLNGFENPYQHMLCAFWRKSENKFNKTVSIKKNRNTSFLSTVWSNKNQSWEIVFMFWCRRVSWDFVGGGSGEWFTLLVFSSLYKFYS